MKKVVFFIINYKSDKYLYRFLESIFEAKKNIETINIELFVLDNSEKNEVEFLEVKKELSKKGLVVNFHRNEKNLGYFGAIPLAQNYLRNIETDFVIYCNPDLRIDSNFFKELLKDKTKGVVAPAIISEEEGIDQNPKYLSRLSVEKMNRLKKVYSTSITYTLFFLLARCKEVFQGLFGKKKHDASLNRIDHIYAPHGAMFIFENVSFFKELKEFPCFLFGEEIFIAEEANKKNISINYNPEIKVFDVRHASISLLSNKFKRELYYSSIDYLLKEYY